MTGKVKTDRDKTKSGGGNGNNDGNSNGDGSRNGNGNHKSEGDSSRNDNSERDGSRNGKSDSDRNGDGDRKRDRNGDGVFAALGLYSQIGVSISACVLIGVFAGIFIDRRFGTSPWFLFLGCLIGTGASFKAMYDLAVKKDKSRRL